jgi:co-chaperonin GroES (HSP10)
MFVQLILADEEAFLQAVSKIYEYFESEVVPGVESVLEALPGRVIVKFPPKAKKSAGGLYIPEQAQIDERVARVVSVGAPVTLEDAMFVREVKAGDLVFAQPRHGEAFLMDDLDGGRDEDGNYVRHEYRLYRMYELYFRLPRKAGNEAQ